MSDWNEKIIAEFRENGGKVGGHFKNTPLLLLHSVGAKSGKGRVNPVAYLEDRGRLYIVASKGGSDNHPDWYFNIKADPKVAIEIGEAVLQAVAQVTQEPERSEIYAKMAAKNSGFTEYEKRTNRVIPVIALDPMEK